MEANGMYSQLGISSEVLSFADGILKDLGERFKKIDETAECNQLKVELEM